jgi:uncharacterized protein YlzI (FlbEa/FlbD family)
MLIPLDVLLDKDFKYTITPFERKTIEILFKSEMPQMRLTQKKFINVNSVESIQLNLEVNLLEVTLISDKKFFIVQSIEEVAQLVNIAAYE